MFRKRFLWILALLVLVSLPLGSALAQGGPPVFCGDLPEADCDILRQSQAVMLTVESGALDLAMEFSLSGVEVMPGVESLAVSLLGEGVFDLNLEAVGDLSALWAMQDMTEEELAELMSTFVETFIALLRAVSFDAAFELVLPDELRAMVPSDAPEDLVLDMVMVDGVLYANVGAFLPPSATETSPWMGLDIATRYEGLFEEMGQTPEMANFIFDMMTDPDLMNTFLSIQRLDDMGGNAVFETTMDYAALFANEAFAAALEDYMMSVVAMEGEELTAEHEAMMAQMVPMLQQLYSGLDISIVQWIGLDDYYVHHTEMAMVFDLDFGALAAFLPEEEREDLPDSFTLGFNLAMDLDAINEPVDVAAPEDAQLIPLTSIAP
jgi:hypothetical protein